MKVLMLDQWLPGQPYSQSLCRQLARHVDLTLCAPRAYHPEGEPFRGLCVLENRVKEKKVAGLLSYFRGIARLGREVLFGGYDVLHVQAFKKASLEIPLLTALCRLRHVRLVATAHNILPHESGGEKEARLLRRWYGACDALIVHNQASRQVLEAFAPEAAPRIHVLPHGTFDSYGRPPAPVPHDKTVFLLFGKIRRYKGICELLQACALLPAEARSRMEVVIAGSQRKGEDPTDYAAMVEDLGLNSFVRLDLRFIDDREVPELLGRADCCLFPYREIYGSGALLLSYGFERPVIASNLPTFVEETDNGATGLLYESGSPEALRDALLRFLELSPGEKARMQEAIRTLCHTKYTWETSARELFSIYDALCAPASS